MEEKKRYIIKNERLRMTNEMTKSTIHDIYKYLNDFDPGKNLSLEKQIERYEELISILKETVSSYNDNYALSYGVGIPRTEVTEWQLPEDPKEKVDYIKNNLSYFVAKYEMLKAENADLKPGQKPKLIGFTANNLKKFLADYKEINNLLKSHLKKYADPFTELYIDGLSLQEYADKYFEGSKRKAQYLSDKITAELEQYYQTKRAIRLNEIQSQISKEKTIRIVKLYSEAEDRVAQRMAEMPVFDDETYYDIYKEEMLKVDRLLEEEEENDPVYEQKRIAKLNKAYPGKNWKSVEFDKNGKIKKETPSTSMIHDVEGDEEFIDNKIFKKKK